MEWKCGAHICWLYMRIFNPRSVYEHMKTAHGDMHEDEQKVALRMIALRRAQEGACHRQFVDTAAQGWWRSPVNIRMLAA